MYKFLKILILTIFSFLSFNNLAFTSEDKIKIGLLVPLTGEDKEIGQQIVRSTRIAILVDLTICCPISLSSPVKGTNKPILILSSEVNAKLLKDKKEKIVNIRIFKNLYIFHDTILFCSKLWLEIWKQAIKN